jgi:hypothetical protein
MAAKHSNAVGLELVRQSTVRNQSSRRVAGSSSLEPRSHSGSVRVNDLRGSEPTPAFKKHASGTLGGATLRLR